MANIASEDSGATPDTGRAQRFILGPVARISMTHFAKGKIAKATRDVTSRRRNQTGE